MKSSGLAVLVVLAMASATFAQWQPYKEGGGIIAAFNYDTFAQFQGKPSVWVRWQYISPENGTGGRKIHFMADCAANKLYEIAEYPFDSNGKYLASNRYYDAPKEFPVTPGSLNEATYKLLCR